MKYCLVILLFFVGFTLVTCSNSNNEMHGDKPPKAVIEIGDNTFETVLGTYCWKGNGKAECVDKAGPKEILRGKAPIKVRPGENITFKMKYKPKPNEIHVLQISENGEHEINVEKHSFQAPMQRGTYYYSYGVWWMDNKKEHVSHGDASYHFVIEVE